MGVKAVSYCNSCAVQDVANNLPAKHTELDTVALDHQSREIYDQLFEAARMW